MKKQIALTVAVTLSLCGSLVIAQTNLPKIYHIQNNVKVTVGGKQLLSPWSGGQNNPQFSIADLNMDGKKDLVIYEDYIGVSTYLNTGTNGKPNYVYDGNYALTFPYAYSYMKLEDYNNDLIPDLFEKGVGGFEVYTGFYDNDKRLNFKHYKDIRYKVSNGTSNAYSGPGDIPIVIDIDKDGDLDFLAYDFGGSGIGFYRNCAIEEGLPKDSIKICYADRCWGRFLQNYERTMQLGFNCEFWGGTTCKSASKTTHAGNTLCMLDMDGDGDWDLLNGNVSFNDIQYLKNGKRDLSYSADSMISQDSTWGANGYKLETIMWPAAFHLDVDQDGDKDLLFSPHAKGYENYNCIIYYANTGSDAAPNFVYQSQNFMMDEMIDIGSFSYPVFYDYNKDGKKDLFIGSRGYFQQDGSFKVKIAYYENTSTASNPSLNLVTTDFMNLSTKNLKGGALSFGDIDNDGKDDMVLGQFDGTIIYYKNTAADNTVQPIWTASSLGNLRLISNRTIDVGDYAAPLVYDLDKDGKNDLIVGCQSGLLYYFKNLGATGNAAFDSITNKLGDIQIKQPGHANTYSTPFIGAVDDTKKEYLLIGSKLGDIFIYDGFQSGGTTGYTMLDSAYQGLIPGPYSTPAVTDIDGDGKFELVAGNELGGVRIFRQTFNVGVENPMFAKADITLYPNPAKDMLNLSWSDVFEGHEVSVSLVTATGQTVLKHIAQGSARGMQLNVAELPSGIYYCTVQSPVRKAVSPVTIVR